MKIGLSSQLQKADEMLESLPQEVIDALLTWARDNDKVSLQIEIDWDPDQCSANLTMSHLDGYSIDCMIDTHGQAWPVHIRPTI